MGSKTITYNLRVPILYLTKTCLYILYFVPKCLAKFSNT